MTAATARRVAALRARAAHPGTPPAEAATCRAMLARLVPAAAAPATCTCARCVTTVYAAAGWRRIACGAWASS